MKRIKKNSKAYRIINFISRSIALILLLAVIALSGFAIYLNIFPLKYLIIVGVLLIVITGCTLFVLISNKIRAKWKIIISFMSLLIISGICFGLVAGFDVLDFINKLANKDYMTENYYVVVLKNSVYSQLDDLANTNIVLYDNGSEGIKDVVKQVKTEIPVTITESIDLATMTSSLLSGETTALIMESSYKNILDEQDDVFKTSTKIIYTINVKVKIKTTVKEVGITTEPFIVYISGVDTYGPITSVSRSDVNIVATINPQTKKVLLTSIPRDYYVQLHGTTGYKDKLTHAGIYGISMSIKTIEDLLANDINYYIKVNFDSLIKIVDIIGGIDINLAQGFSTPEYRFVVGNNHMNGKKALAFSRERHSFAGGDRARGENQELVIKAIIEKVSSPSILTKYASILNSLEGTFETNVSATNIKKLVKMQLDDMASWQITSANLDGSDSSNYTYSFGGQMLYVMEPKLETIDQAKKAIAKIKSN